MENVKKEAKIYMGAVGEPVDTKTETAGAHFLPPVPISVAPIESKERYVVNTSPELVMMAPHSNICDYRPNTNDSLDGVIPKDETKEASAENPG